MADLALILTMAVWGSSFSLLRFFLQGGDPAGAVSPLLFLALRMAVAAALLGAFLLARGALRRARPGAAPMVAIASDSPGLRGLLRDGLLCGSLLGLGFLLQTEGLQRTTASRSGFLTGLLVVFVPLFDLVLFKKRPGGPALIALGLAFAGMVLLAGGFQAGGTRLGDLLTVGCALVFAGHILALARAAPRHPVLHLLMCQLLVVGAMAAIAGPLIEPARLPLDGKLALATAYLSLFATLLAFGVQTWAQQRVSPVRVALLSALEPVFAALFAAALLRERLSARELLGGALIVFGVVIGEVGTALLARRRANSL